MSSYEEEIAQRLESQRRRIAHAAESCGRSPDSVVLIAVSKKHPPSAIEAAYSAGQRDFGENYVQELVAKAEQLAHLPEIRWHMIGHLQSNKARFVAPLVERVHTISSAKLARELGARVAQRKRTVAASPDGTRARASGIEQELPPSSVLPLGVLVEVNVSGEESKSGCSPRELQQVLSAVDAQPYLRLCGLMTMPPASKDPGEARPYFDQLTALQEIHGGRGRLPELSMGMSGDAEVAIVAGATHVRIGTAIFGSRPAK